MTAKAYESLKIEKKVFLLFRKLKAEYDLEQVRRTSDSEFLMTVIDGKKRGIL